MTNQFLIAEYRRAVAEHGELVPRLFAHLFAGCGRKRFWELCFLGRVPIVKVGGLEFVPLSWIETRRTAPGRRGLLWRIRNGQARASSSDRPLASRYL